MRCTPSSNNSIAHVWLNQPGNYSGDTWHIAAAMLLHPTLRVIQTVSDKQRDAVFNSLKARAFYCSIGLGTRIDVTFMAHDLANGLRESRVRDRLCYNQRNVDVARNQLHRRGLAVDVFPAVKATEFVLAAIRSRDVKDVLSEVSSGFCIDFEHAYPIAARRIAETAQSIPERAMLIIGRYASYHRCYNANAELLKQFMEIAKETNRDPVLIASRRSERAIQATKNLMIRWIDPFDIHDSVGGVWGTRFANLQSTAYFWKSLSARNAEHIVVGGRSGFTDIAALMQMHVVQWDAFDFQDPESVRLAEMSPRLCSTVDIAGPRPWHEALDHVTVHGNAMPEKHKMTAIDVLREICGDEIEKAYVEW